MKKLASARPSPALIVAILALFVALGGVSYAATQLSKNSVGAKQIRNASVNSAKIKNGTLRSVDFTPGVLPSVPDPGISGYEQVTHHIANSPANSHSGTATCPPGKIVLSGGAYLFLAEGQVVIDESYPNSATSYYAQSRKIGGPLSGDVDHGLTVFAICADAIPAG